MLPAGCDMCCCCVQVCFVLVSQSLAGESSQSDVNRRLILYCLCFAGFRFWALVNRCQNVTSPNHPLFGLYLLHALFSPLQGLGNALVFGANKRFRDHYAIMCSSNPARQLELAASAHTAFMAQQQSDGLLLSIPAAVDSPPARPDHR